MPTYSTKIKLVILSISIALLIAAGYFYFFQKTSVAPEIPLVASPVFGEKKSLADDENYVGKKAAEFLANDPPGTSIEYAKDVVYDEIAFQEQNKEICEKIKNKNIKEHCNLSVNK